MHVRASEGAPVAKLVHATNMPVRPLATAGHGRHHPQNLITQRSSLHTAHLAHPTPLPHACLARPSYLDAVLRRALGRAVGHPLHVLLVVSVKLLPWPRLAPLDEVHVLDAVCGAPAWRRRWRTSGGSVCIMSSTIRS